MGKQGRESVYCKDGCVPGQGPGQNQSPSCPGSWGYHLPSSAPLSSLKFKFSSRGCLLSLFCCPFLGFNPNGGSERGGEFTLHTQGGSRSWVGLNGTRIQESGASLPGVIPIPLLD